MLKSLSASLALALVMSLGCSGEKAAPPTPTTTATPAPAATTAPATPTPVAAPAAPTGGLLGSCQFAAISCSTYEGPPSPAVKEACLKYKGTWSDAACPAAGIAGTCLSTDSGVRLSTHTYAPGTADTAKTACGNTPGGTFVAP